MDFTKQEIQLLKRYSASSNWQYMLWEFIYLVPSIALITFGVIDGSKRSIFVGTGILVVIRIYIIIQQSKTFYVLKGLCNKLCTLFTTTSELYADTERKE